MSNKVNDPNSKSSGFLWAIVAVLVIAAAVVGYIVFSSQGARTEHLADRDYEEVTFEMANQGGVVTLRAANVAAGAPEVDLYEDYSCSYCATLAENTDDDMREAIEDGELVVNVSTLHFLDQGNTNGHSTAAMAAVMAVADAEDPALYWNYRGVLMEEQEDIYNRWDSDDFADAADVLGAPSEVVEAIRSGEYTDLAVAAGEANAQQLEDQTGTVSSPRVVQNGQDVEVADINQWLDAVLED